ncbi:hypothetical protein MMC10_008653 [Thelotrema lepadinum]|nr:hypothetical protein [Thelotrema lepadinum]
MSAPKPRLLRGLSLTQFLIPEQDQITLNISGTHFQISKSDLFTMCPNLERLLRKPPPQPLPSLLDQASAMPGAYVSAQDDNGFATSHDSGTITHDSSASPQDVARPARSPRVATDFHLLSRNPLWNYGAFQSLSSACLEQEQESEKSEASTVRRISLETMNTPPYLDMDPNIFVHVLDHIRHGVFPHLTLPNGRLDYVGYQKLEQQARVLGMPVLTQGCVDFMEHFTETDNDETGMLLRKTFKDVLQMYKDRYDGK